MMPEQVWVLFIVAWGSTDGETFTRQGVMIQDAYVSEADCLADGKAFTEYVDAGRRDFDYHDSTCTPVKLRQRRK